MNTLHIGKKGEDMALKLLKKKGYRLFVRNFRAGHKELDLVMMDGDCLVFVEVKARSSLSFGQPQEFVNYKKQQNLIMAANRFIAENGYHDKSARFDIVEVCLGEGILNHIINAFGA